METFASWPEGLKQTEPACHGLAISTETPTIKEAELLDAVYYLIEGGDSLRLKVRVLAERTKDGRLGRDAKLRDSPCRM